jgi:hypothetical protein
VCAETDRIGEFAELLAAKMPQIVFAGAPRGVIEHGHRGLRSESSVAAAETPNSVATSREMPTDRFATMSLIMIDPHPWTPLVLRFATTAMLRRSPRKFAWSRRPE